VPDWLDSCCWRCGSQTVDPAVDGRVLCGACRDELDSEVLADPLSLARHAYWEAHVLRCCWRCMTGAVDPDDEIGMCSSCRAQIAEWEAEGAA
jgi:predicted amidophosphoribosyltransferase